MSFYQIIVLLIVNQTYDELALAGNYKVLSVGVSSNPELTISQITWMIGDHLTIINGSKYSITFNATNVFLTIFDVTREDADTYILTVTNDVVGETMSVEVHLNVQGECQSMKDRAVASSFEVVRPEGMANLRP